MGIKPIHPIRKMRKELERRHYIRRMLYPDPIQLIEQDMARHVKPLLDALEFDHTERWQHKNDSECETCQLLAAWRAKP